MKEDKTKKTWGGRREGAGRPKTDGKNFAFRAGGELAKLIEEQRDKSGFIRDCIQVAMAARTEVPDFTRLGEVYPATSVREMTVPFFDIGVVAGFPIPLDNDERAQDIELLQMLCPHPEASYLIRVQGDSMIEAGIQSGDIIIVDKSNRNPSETEVAVCELNGEYTIKYVHKEEGRGVLVPANPNYPKIPIKDGDSFSIWGVVTFIIHKA